MLFNKKSLLSFIFLFSYAISSIAQSTLPNIDVLSKDGINILGWVSPYESGVKSVTVQRSADSTYNFRTIGIITNLKTKNQNFIDAHPLLGNNFYRVVLTFNSEIEWISNLAKVVVDSNAIAHQKAIPTNDSLQKLIDKLGDTAVLNNLNSVSYPKSRYVFTNPFTGNVNIEIPDALDNNYSLVFYDQKDKQILEIPKVQEQVVILDKRNFQSNGVFKFKLFKDKKEFEKGVITIY